jgi:hypothetical protein
MTTIDFNMQPRNLDEITIKYCQHEWISIKEKMPNIHERVLVFNGDRHIEIASYRGNGWGLDTNYRSDHTLSHFASLTPFECYPYWMTLPSPPKDK